MDIIPRQYEDIAVNDNDVHSIVMLYLVHNCFTDTVELFTASTGIKQTTNHLEDMEKRKKGLEFAQLRLAPFAKMQKYVEKLEDFMSLLAYNEPEKSPTFHLLSLEYRQQVADSLNRAIVANSNLPSYSAVERLMQQTTVVRQCLSQESNKEGHPPFSLKDFLKSYVSQFRNMFPALEGAITAP